MHLAIYEKEVFKVHQHTFTLCPEQAATFKIQYSVYKTFLTYQTFLATSLLMNDHRANNGSSQAQEMWHIQNKGESELG